MRYMVMHKTNAFWEAGAQPTPEEVRRVGEMVGELNRSGIMLDGEGLGPSAEGARVRISKGRSTVTPGPFDGVGALPARYAIFRAETVEQAAEIAAKFGVIFGDVVVDVRPVNEPWDIGFGEKPEGLTTRRYMAVVNATPVSEAGTPLSADQRAALKAFSDELERAGVLLGIRHFEPSVKGKRIRLSTPAKGASGPAPKGKTVVLDGPFSETKELIGGFVTVEVESIEDAVRLARSYAEAVEVEEIDVRGLVSDP